MARETRDDLRLELLAAVWRRRKWLGIFVFTAAASAAVSLVAFMPNIYQATTTVLVEGQQVPETFVKSTVTSALETRLHTIKQEILSRPRLEELIARFELYPQLRSRLSHEELVNLMREHIQVEFKGMSGRTTVAFALSYRAGDPEKAASVANALATFYVDENVKVRERQSADTADFLRKELEETGKRLAEQERRVSEFKMRHLGELPQQTEANLAILERFHTQLRLNNDRQIRAMNRRDGLATPAPGADAAGTRPSQPEAAPANLEELRAQLTGLRLRFTDQYPDVIRVKDSIARLETELGQAQRAGQSDIPRQRTGDPSVRGRGLALLELDGETKALKAEEQLLRNNIATYQARVESAPRREQELLELSRDYQSIRELYQSLSKRHEEAHLAERLEQRQKGEQFRILDPALPPQTPAAPNRLRLTLLGLAMSLGASVGVVVLAERLDTSFHTVDQLRSFTGLAILASIPRIVSPTHARRHRRRARFGTAAAILGLIVIVGAGYVVAHRNEQLVWMLSRGRS